MTDGLHLALVGSSPPPPAGRSPIVVSAKAAGGYTLLVVLFFASISLLVLGSALKWSMTNSHLNDATTSISIRRPPPRPRREKVLANLSRDYQAQGESLVWANVSGYRLLTPTTGESDAWSGFTFRDVSGSTNRTYVERLAASALRSASIPVPGHLRPGLDLPRHLERAHERSALRHERRRQAGRATGLDPDFPVAIFYSMDLEINPGPNMAITGRVHGNNNINLQPVSTLTFLSHVTAAGAIINNKHTNDPTVRSLAAAMSSSRASMMPTRARLLSRGHQQQSGRGAGDSWRYRRPPRIRTPRWASSAFYNKADLVVLVSNTTVTVTSVVCSTTSPPPSPAANGISGSRRTHLHQPA